MYILKDVDFSKLIKRNLNEKHTLLIEYLDLNGKKQKKHWRNNGRHIHVEGIKELTKARVGNNKAWKNVLNIVKEKMLVEGKVGLTKEFYITNKTLLFYFGFNLNLTTSNTVMACNYLNRLMENNNEIILLSPFPIKNIFLQNLVFNKYTIINCNKENHKELFKKYENKCDLIFIRQLKNINSLKNETYLKKTIIYEDGAELDNIKELNNEFHSIITQSEKLKKTIEDNGVYSANIRIIEPFVYKYDFDLPERIDNEIRLIYCGTLRDEENIIEIIEQFKKIHKERSEIVLKIVYDFIVGTDKFKDQVKQYINNGVDGITFIDNLSHKDACYHIATSDIGICWRKNEFNENGKNSMKMKEYEIYGINLCRDDIYLKRNEFKKNITVTVICCAKRPSYHYNILNNLINLSKDNYNIKLLLCLNNESLNQLFYKRFFHDNKIENEIIKLDKSLSQCLNTLISKTNTRVIFKIDEDDIYLPGLLNKCIPYLYKNTIISTSERLVYCPENKKLYINENNSGCYSLIGLKKKDKFEIKFTNDDTYILKNNKTKILDLRNYHIHIKHINNEKDAYHFKYYKEIIKDNLKHILDEHGLFDIYNQSKKNSNLLNKNILNYRSNYKRKKFININKLSIIGIFDEFLYNTYKNIFNIKLINPKEKIDKKYDFFMCESSWNGNSGNWKSKINNKTINKELLCILNQCKKKNIPSIFFNKEDPVSFDLYIDTAKHFDIIITTDVNCISKYKEITNSNIFVMPFTIDPLSINNIGRNNDNNKSFFAGSFKYNLSEERKKNTNLLLNKFIDNKNEMYLFDRSLNKKQREDFYNNMYTLNMFAPKYNKYIHECISHEKLLDVHLNLNWCGNLNTVTDSDTMFARRVLEASIMKNSILTDYSRGVYKNFKNSIYKFKDELKYETNEDILLNQIKKQIGWRNIIQNYNSYTHFKNIFEKINIKGFINPFLENNKISIICLTSKIYNFHIIQDNFFRQKYTNKELIIIINLNMNDEIKEIIKNNIHKNIMIKQINKEETFDFCVSEAISLSDGNVISIFNDNDYYGKNYLTDMNFSMIISNAQLLGKCAHMVYLEESQELWIKFYKINYENYIDQKSDYICKGSIFFKKDILKKCNLQEDIKKFIEDVKSNNFTVYVSDFFNYCKRTNNDHFEESINIKNYENIPINLIDV